MVISKRDNPPSLLFTLVSYDKTLYYASAKFALLNFRYYLNFDVNTINTVWIVNFAQVFAFSYACTEGVTLISFYGNESTITYL